VQQRVSERASVEKVDGAGRRAVGGVNYERHAVLALRVQRRHGLQHGCHAAEQLADVGEGESGIEAVDFYCTKLLPFSIHGA
jgi:hypothetical protein